KGVRDDAGGEEGLAVRVEVEAPGVTGALSKSIELPLADVVAPDGGVELHAHHPRLRENALQAVKRPVGPPLHGVERLVRVVAAEALQEDFLPGTTAGPLGIAEEKQVGGGPQENAAVAGLDAGGQVEAGRQVFPLGPDRYPVRLAGAGGVFQD